MAFAINPRSYTTSVDSIFWFFVWLLMLKVFINVLQSGPHLKMRLPQSKRQKSYAVTA